MTQLKLSQSKLSSLKEDFSKNPKFISFRLNSSQDRLAYIGSDSKGHANLFVSEKGNFKDFKQLSFYEDPEVIQFFWSALGDKLIVVKDIEGTGALRLHLYDIHTSEMQDLSKDFKNASSQVVKMHAYKNLALVGFNERNSSFHDLYLMNLDTGERELILENNEYIKFLISEELDVILKMKIVQGGAWECYTSDGQLWLELDEEEAFHSDFLSFSTDENKVYFLDNRQEDTTQLLSKDLLTKKETLVAYSLKSDIQDVILDKSKPVAWADYYLKKKWHAVDKAFQSDLEFLEETLQGQFDCLSFGDKLYLLSTSLPSQGQLFYIYHREQGKLEVIGSDGKKDQFHSMYPFEYKARDGLTLTAYYTLPKEYDRGGITDEALPLVVIPHGGPFKVRDYYSFNHLHQWVASQGYVALSMNFRLSSGLGKKLVMSGFKEYGGKAHQDVIDAVEACIAKKIADRNKLAVFGGSYGGYEALASLCFSPGYFKCAVALCAPSNFLTLIGKFPNYWEWTLSPLADRKAFFTKQSFISSMGGDPDREEDREFLSKCSPLFYTDKITEPLLLVHGENDHIVPEQEARQIYQKLKSKGKRVKYLYFPDEGHRFAKFENRVHYLDFAERFLSENLGGHYSPSKSDVLDNSSAILYE
ncbi:MAG: S9 family peptidase [Chlamydiales bacterium]|nr:S9 family peptidase [Chlamydiales bacterium]